MLEKKKWKYGKTFAYSITYDEGFDDLLKNTLPIHEEFGIPGHVSMVVSQIGQYRNLPGSSYDKNFRHMDCDQLRFLISKGWSVSSHSMTHGTMSENTYMEVVESRLQLEEMLGIPVTAFIVPGNNDNHPPVVPYARENGYLSVYTVTDGLNNYDSDFYALCRAALVEEGFAPFFTRYDHYHRLLEAREYGGWIVDYTHLSNPTVLCPQKEISQDGLKRRFEKIREIGGDEVWTAVPEEVVDYILTNKHTEIVELRKTDEKISFKLKDIGIPVRVQNRQLTFGCEMPVKLRRPAVIVNGKQKADVTKMYRNRLLFTLEVKDGMRVEITDLKQSGLC